MGEHRLCNRRLPNPWLLSVDHIEGKLSAEHFEFLHALYRAANDPEEIYKLEQVFLWKDSPALLLQTSKPIYGNSGA